MTCRVKYRINNGPWEVFPGDIDATSYRDAEVHVAAALSRIKQVPKTCIDVKAVRIDSKSVWQHK